MPIYRVGATTGVAPATVAWGRGSVGSFSDVTGYVGGYQTTPTTRPPLNLLPVGRAATFGQDVAGFDYRADNADPTYSTATTTGGIADASPYPNLNLVPAASGSRPTLVQGGQGGHAYTSLDGVDDRLSYRSSTYNVFAVSRPGVTIETVARFETTATMTTNRYVMQVSSTAAGSSRVGIYVDTAGRWVAEGRRLDGDAVTTGVGPTADDAVHHLLVVMDYENARQRFYIDGVLVVDQPTVSAAGLSPATPSQMISWGSAGSPSQFWQGDIYGQAGAAHPMSDDEVAARWADVQADHQLTAPPVDSTNTGAAGSATAGGVPGTGAGGQATANTGAPGAATAAGVAGTGTARQVTTNTGAPGSSTAAGARGAATTVQTAPNTGTPGAATAAGTRGTVTAVQQTTNTGAPGTADAAAPAGAGTGVVVTHATGTGAAAAAAAAAVPGAATTVQQTTGTGAPGAATATAPRGTATAVVVLATANTGAPGAATGTAPTGTGVGVQSTTNAGRPAAATATGVPGTSAVEAGAGASSNVARPGAATGTAPTGTATAVQNTTSTGRPAPATGTTPPGEATTVQNAIGTGRAADATVTALAGAATAAATVELIGLAADAVAAGVPGTVTLTTRAARDIEVTARGPVPAHRAVTGPEALDRVHGPVRARRTTVGPTGSTVEATAPTGHPVELIGDPT